MSQVSQVSAMKMNLNKEWLRQRAALDDDADVSAGLDGIVSASLIPLRRAVICSGCDVISDARGERCPACGETGGLLALSRVLGRTGDGDGRADRDISAGSNPADCLEEVTDGWPATRSGIFTGGMES